MPFPLIPLAVGFVAARNQPTWGFLIAFAATIQRGRPSFRWRGYSYPLPLSRGRLVVCVGGKFLGSPEASEKRDPPGAVRGVKFVVGPVSLASSRADSPGRREVCGVAFLDPDVLFGERRIRRSWKLDCLKETAAQNQGRRQRRSA